MGRASSASVSLAGSLLRLRYPAVVVPAPAVPTPCR